MRWRSFFTAATQLVILLLFASACASSSNVAPQNDAIEEIDQWNRTMALPVGEIRTDTTGKFVAVEHPPRLLGGLKGLQAQMDYPAEARQRGVEGVVFLQFTVESDGVPTDVVVTRSIGAGCDQEAVRVVSQARFIPAVQDGHRVPVKMSLPITFKLKR